MIFTVTRNPGRFGNTATRMTKLQVHIFIDVKKAGRLRNRAGANASDKLFVASYIPGIRNKGFY